MIFPGQVVQTSVLCPECGKAMNNSAPQGSDFLMCSCRMEGCSGMMMLIEKSTSIVLWTSATWSFDEGTYSPAYPVLANKDGKQVWPKVEIPIEKPTS